MPSPAARGPRPTPSLLAGHASLAPIVDEWVYQTALDRTAALELDPLTRAKLNEVRPFRSPFRDAALATIRNAERVNVNSPGSVCVVGVTGPTLAGKSTTVLYAILEDLAPQEPPISAPAGLEAPGPVFDWVPVVWVTPGDQGPLGLMRNIAHYIGLPLPQSRTADQILNDVSNLFPQLGTRYLVIDDLHSLRESPDGRTVTFIREAISKIPATVILIGLGIADEVASILAGRQSTKHDAEQVHGRTDWIDLTVTPPANDEDCLNWAEPLWDAAAGLYLAEEPSEDELAAVMLVLLEGSGGRYGKAFQILNRAAFLAAGWTERLTVEVVEAAIAGPAANPSLWMK